MAEWTKHPANPVLGPGICTQAVFDCCVVPEGDRLRMWFSWRDLCSVAYCESPDGVHWTGPRTCLEPDPNIAWEKDDLNRPHVLRVGDTWYMWYTGQNNESQQSQIGLANATSIDFC